MSNILLVNPWIYDFAAYDYGIKPVGLLRIGEYLRRNGHKVSLIDCLAGCSKNKDEYGFSKIVKAKTDKPSTIKHIKRPYFRYGILIDSFLSQLDAMEDIDRIFITSGMTYWYPGVQLVIKLLKERLKNVPITLGGIYATLCYKHASMKSGADKVFKKDFLKKEYFLQHGFYPAYDLLREKEILPIQLTRGCPFRCSYCASDILNPRFQMKDPINLFEEIMYYNEQFGTRSFVFYDDALCYRPQRGLKRFLRLVIAARKKFIFHTPNGLHAKFIDEELAELFKKSNFKDLRLSLETSDEDLQYFTGGKVNNNDLKIALRNLKEAGFNKKDLGIYLLIGANWLDIEKTKEDILFVNSLGVKAVLASYSSIPGTVDYNSMVKNSILKKDMDPLWHNKAIFSELLEPNLSERIQKIRRFASSLNKSEV
ncbi:MAG: radical SAM protein [Candidatus Omnitrophota bacterium]